ncbi:hypothetical protein ACJX0J_029248, partial [Zea mays]
FMLIILTDRHHLDRLHYHVLILLYIEHLYTINSFLVHIIYLFHLHNFDDTIVIHLHHTVECLSDPPKKEKEKSSWGFHI